MSKSQRDKGARGEREFLKLLGAELGEMLQRNLAQTRDSGSDCLQVAGWAIEVKRQESLSRPKWWRQACRDADALGLRPMMAYRRNGEPWMVWVRYRDSYVELSLIEAAQCIRESWHEAGLKSLADSLATAEGKA